MNQQTMDRHHHHYNQHCLLAITAEDEKSAVESTDPGVAVLAVDRRNDEAVIFPIL